MMNAGAPGGAGSGAAAVAAAVDAAARGHPRADRPRGSTPVSRSHASSALSTSCRRLSGKVAIVTGSTEGIGAAIARRLGQEGARVVVSSRKPARVEEGIDAIGIPCHVGKPDDRDRLVKETVDKWGRIDIFVPNVAVSPHFGRTIDTPARAFDKLFEINVRAPFLQCQQMVPHMPEGSSITFVASYAAFHPDPMLVYGITKTALVGLTKALGKELAHNGIRVNCICPGLIDTRFSSALTSSDEVVKEVMRNTFMGRVGEASECAGIVAFLSSSDASYITGESIVVAGGIPGRL